MTVIHGPKPETGDYRVHRLHEGPVTVAYVTVYGSGKRTFEFDSDRPYTEDEVAEVLRLGRSECHV